jgi:hypothetical protein
MVKFTQNLSLFEKLKQVGTAVHRRVSSGENNEPFLMFEVQKY